MTRLNRGSLVSETTALPTAPRPLPELSDYFSDDFYSANLNLSITRGTQLQRYCKSDLKALDPWEVKNITLVHLK